MFVDSDDWIISDMLNISYDNLLNTAYLYVLLRRLYLRDIIINNNILFNTNLKI